MTYNFSPPLSLENLIVYTDMDGTLLDHHTYQFDAASSTIDELHKKSAIITPNTSKTYSEVVTLREKIGLPGPFIIENGAAVYIPKPLLDNCPEDCIDGEIDGTEDEHEFYIKRFSKPRAFWLDILKKLDAEHHAYFERFSTMSLRRVSELTGLTLNDAADAQDRRYGEPLYWLGNDRQKYAFIDAIKALGGNILEGGRFLHLSDNTDKGVAAKWLTQTLNRQLLTHKGEKNSLYTSIGLGDGKNDIAMLESVDISIVIKSPVNDAPIINKKNNVFHTTLMGPEGWAHSINNLILTPEEVTKYG